MKARRRKKRDPGLGPKKRVLTMASGGFGIEVLYGVPDSRLSRGAKLTLPKVLADRIRARFGAAGPAIEGIVDRATEIFRDAARDIPLGLTPGLPPPAPKGKAREHLRAQTEAALDALGGPRTLEWALANDKITKGQLVAANKARAESGLAGPVCIAELRLLETLCWLSGATTSPPAKPVQSEIRTAAHKLIQLEQIIGRDLAVDAVWEAVRAESKSRRDRDERRAWGKLVRAEADALLASFILMPVDESKNRLEKKPFRELLLHR